ncbi:putative signal-transduction histidine kinase senX3 [Winkia neuii]|uniref:sensor histidine kinase n=1 Tax=Winkia neuii TaxID=33007 RepID=UPI00079B9D58|nr:ATP-binding protein [Winkia neuii]KWZ75006.1 putative signal-transduction histidine kinase senX3 [Winkia neuii]
MSLGVTILAALLCLTVGVGSMVAYMVSEKSRQKPVEVERPVLSSDVLSVLAVIPGSAIVLDRQNRVVRAGASALAYGFIRNDKLVNEELLRDVSELRAQGRVSERTLTAERGGRPSTPLRLQIRVAPMAHGHVLILINDVSAAERVQDMRVDFTANVSHELKTPVGAIRLLTETIRENADDPKAVAHFSKNLEKETDRLVSLVRDIMDLSRISVEDPLSKGIAVTVDSVVREATDRCKILAENAGVTLKVGEPCYARVYGNRDQLVTAVRNLVDNAIRYSEPNTPVSVSAKVEDDLVRIAVVDRGIGIPASARNRIFERFYRVDKARSRQTGGTGLGLSIVKHIAAQHRGTVTCWSTEGAGSTFTLVLPEASELSGSQN